MPDPWLEPVRRGYPDPGHFGLSGEDQLRAMLLLGRPGSLGAAEA